ncbi:MAG: dihydroorotate dehydrogenase [Candidatus Omnitrophica bacterium]|nr:dihydroorotate dehydrogenase [Candidatus Omnitrophota bacterium]
MQNKLSVNIGKLKLKNPVMVASGTFGYAEEFKDFIDLKQLGAIVTKTITLKPRQGNPSPRTCETPSGMLNSIGLENPGMEGFIKEKLPALQKIGVPLIISISSEDNPQELVILARQLDKIKTVAAVELNISCPNLQKTKLISQDAHSTYEVVKEVRKVTHKIIITKLSPNVACIADIAQAAESAGSDAVSLINTLPGLCIDVEKRMPKLACVTGGLSGPAVRPVAVRMVWEVFQKVKIPIIGMGGIMNTCDALEFMLAGATAVSIGTANFVNPRTAIEIISGLKKYCQEHNIDSIKKLTGSLKCQN